MNIAYYWNLRNKYKPIELKIIFILESPPVSGKYFYDEEGTTKEPLFSAMMKLLNNNPKNKHEGLTHFADSGYFIVDATYEPVNKLKGKKRDEKILENYNNLVSDLEGLGDTKHIGLILVKANICRLFENRLLEAGFNALNDGIIIPFPSTGQQNKFHIEIKKVMEY